MITLSASALLVAFHALPVHDCVLPLMFVARGRPPRGPLGGWRTVRAITAAAMGPGAVRRSRGGMALGRGRGGVLNVIKDKSLQYEYEEKTEMRQIQKNQNVTFSFEWVVTCLLQNENDPRVDTHILVVGFAENDA